MIFASNRWIRLFGPAIVCAAFLSNACAGKAEDRGSGQQSPAGSGGSNDSVAGGGTAPIEQGGAPAAPQAGAATSEEGGAESFDEGGSTTVAKGGAMAAGGTNHGFSGAPSSAAGAGPCAKVICGSIPNSCKHIVQSAGECCPTCTDTGCAECAELSCDPGTHSATLPGDCCPTCVTDPPDACAQGKKLYNELRGMLFEKYSSGGCKNSADCAITNEDNACASVCNIALPAQSVHNWVSNLDNDAKGCVSCEAPPPLDCTAQIAACVNGKCVGVDTGL